MAESPDPADVRTPLTELLQRRMDENGWRLADVTRPPDGTRPGAPARSTMSQHLQRGYWLSTMPRPKTIDELATAVRVNAEEIREAAWRSLDANRGQDHHREAAAVGLGRQSLDLAGLTEEQQQTLRSIAEAYRAQNPKADS